MRARGKRAGDERERLWAIACDNYSGYARYQERAGARVIPGDRRRTALLSSQAQAERLQRDEQEHEKPGVPPRPSRLRRTAKQDVDRDAGGARDREPLAHSCHRRASERQSPRAIKGCELSIKLKPRKCRSPCQVSAAAARTARCRSGTREQQAGAEPADRRDGPPRPGARAAEGRRRARAGGDRRGGRSTIISHAVGAVAVDAHRAVPNTDSPAQRSQPRTGSRR